MSNNVICPATGFRQFGLYRGYMDDEYQIVIGGHTYLFESIDALRLWFHRIQFPMLATEAALDMIHNFRYVVLDRDDPTRIDIAQIQDHPHPEQAKSETSRSFRYPRIRKR